MKWTIKILSSIRYRAKELGVEFNLTTEDIIIPEVCPILKEPFDLTCVAKSRNAPTIDRIRARGGYVRGNVQVISWYANRLKSDCDDPEIFEAIAQFLRAGRIS